MSKDGANASGDGNPIQPSLPADLRLSDGLIAIRLLQIAGMDITERYLVLRADNGGTIGYYENTNG
jgi:hypothetical protein